MSSKIVINVLRLGEASKTVHSRQNIINDVLYNIIMNLIT